MNAMDLLRSAGGAFSHRLRAALTLLGIVIGSGSIVLLASLIVGGRTLLVEQNQRVTDDDIIVVETKEAPPAQHDKTTRPLARGDRDDLAGASALNGAEVVAEASHWEMMHVGGDQKWINVVSATPATLRLYRLAIASGRMLDATDDGEGHRVCVVGHNIHEEMFGGKPIAAGMSLAVGGERFTVVGALAEKPAMGGKNGGWVWDNKILLPESTFDATYAPDHKVASVYVRGPSAKEARTAARTTVLGLVLRRHFGVANVKLRDEQSGGTEELIMTIIEVLLLGTGVLALVASGINIMNVMLVSVTERKKEIGLRRAIGATPRSIMLQFLLEAVTLSVTGGVAGVAAGAGLSWLIAVGARASLGRWELALPAWSIALGLGLALVTGVVFGLAPAWRAAKIAPIDALRSE